MVVRHTTRAAEDGEENGTHYHFVDDETFAADVAEGKFIEHVARGGSRRRRDDPRGTRRIGGGRGGTRGTSATRGDVRDVSRSARGGDGRRQNPNPRRGRGEREGIKAQMPDGAFVFVVPASVDALEGAARRGLARTARQRIPAEDDEEALAEMDAKIAARLDTIAREMEGFQEEGLFTDVVVNEELELRRGREDGGGARHPSAVTPPPAPLVVSGPSARVARRRSRRC